MDTRFLRRPASALLALVLASTHAIAQAPPAFVVRLQDDAIIFRGQINARSAAEFLKLLQETPAIRRVVITSGGGGVIAAIGMAEAIHERQLDVEVPTACLSSCANYIFPAGRNKTLGRPDAVGWHGNIQHVMFLQQTGRADPLTQSADARELAQREAEFFRRIGVDGYVGWFAKLEPYGVDGFYTLRPADMARFGMSNVSVRDPTPTTPGNAEVRMVTVDWERLEASRPAVRLEP